MKSKKIDRLNALHIKHFNEVIVRSSLFLQTYSEHMLSVFLFLLSFRTAHRAHWNNSKVYFCTSELQRFNKRMKKRKHLAILFICFSCWWYFPITRYSCWFLLHSLRIYFSSSFMLDEPFYTANKVQICSEQEQRIISLTMNMVFFTSRNWNSLRCSLRSLSKVLGVQYNDFLDQKVLMIS